MTFSALTPFRAWAIKAENINSTIAEQIQLIIKATFLCSIMNVL